MTDRSNSVYGEQVRVCAGKNGRTGAVVVYILRESSAAGEKGTKGSCTQPFYSGISPGHGKGE